MHECSVTEQLVSIAKSHAESANAVSVKKVSVVVGEVTGYMADSLRFYFTLLSRDTILEGAELDVRYIKPRIRCPKCGLLFYREKFSFDCPTCKIPGEMTKEGTEFFIDSIEIEE